MFIYFSWQRPDFTWELNAHMVVHLQETPLGALRVGNVWFQKFVKLNAMDGLKNIDIVDFDLPDNLNWNPSMPDANGLIQGRSYA